MKKKLILLQPQKYNELFSTYHNSKKVTKIFPTITSNLQKDLEITAYTTRTNLLTQNNFNNRAIFSYNKTNNKFKRNIKFLNSLMTQQYSQDNFKNNHEFLPFPSLTQQYKIIDEKSKSKKKFESKKSNFNIIYLNLSNQNNKTNQEYSVEQIEKNEFVNKKIEEINTSKKQKIKEIFNKNEKMKIKDDLSMLNKIPIVLINVFAEDIYNSMKNQKNKIKTNSNINKDLNSKNNTNLKGNILSFDNINKTIYKNNTFFQYVLDNVKHKIELMNDSNKSISILNVVNLINNELSDLKKNVEFFLAENNYQNTSNNISKISNFDFTPSNTFRFKTNNSKLKPNENNFNNNSSVLGNLIKSNIYSKKNDGSKKLFFDNILNSKNRENYIFQNKEIIFSINQNEAKGKINLKNIKKINIPKALKNINNLNWNINGDEIGINTEFEKEKEKFLTSRYYNKSSSNKMNYKQKYFYKHKEEKKISHSFSEIFLKKNYPKASDFINEISNSIEKKYLLKKRKEAKKQNKDSVTQTNNPIKNLKGSKIKKKKYKYLGQDIYNNSINDKYNENNLIRFKKEKDKNEEDYDDEEEEEEEEEDSYEYIKKQNIITPKKSKELFQAFSDNQEKKMKIKNKKMKNNYENIILTMKSIKQEESKLTLTPKKLELRDNELKLEPNSSLNNGQKFSNTNNEPNLIYFDKNKKRNQIIYENQFNLDKSKRKNKKKKNKGKRNQDLTSIKSSKTFENNNINLINKRNLNLNDEENIIKENDKKGKKKRKKKKEKIEILMNLINNNPNIENKEEIIKKFIINSENEKERGINEREGKEEEYYEEDEEEEEGEEGTEEYLEDDEENEEEIKEGKFINKSGNNTNKRVVKKKRRKKKDLQKDFSDNKKLILSSNNINDSDKEVISNKKNDKEIIKRNNDNIYLNLTNTKTKDSFIKKNKSNAKDQALNNRSKKDKTHISLIKNNKNFTKEKKSLQEENIKENPEYKELIKEMEKYNVTNKNDLYNMKHLKVDKQEKQVKGGINQKTTDNSFFTIDDNLDDIIKKNAPPSNINLKNYQKQEELNIVNEVMELDNLTEQEKNYILSEMFNLRNIITKAKIIDKEIKIQINSKRVAIFRLVNKFFINMILNDIKKDSVEKLKYVKKLKKLEKIQNFGIFTYKNLLVLENKYVIPYLDEDERKKREMEERENRKLREQKALEEYENYKKMLEKKKKSQLIYDNSYLFKKEKSKDIKIRKEVEDILNKEYEEFQSHQQSRSNQRLISMITKRKKTDRKRKSKVKHINPKLKKLQMQEESDKEEDNTKHLKDLEEEKKEELKDKKLKEFFERIRKLKNGEFKDFDEELNQLINEIMIKDVISKNKENRMNSFIQNFEYNRQKNKYKSSFHNKGFNFVSPIRFISDIQK